GRVRARSEGGGSHDQPAGPRSAEKPEARGRVALGRARDGVHARGGQATREDTDRAASAAGLVRLPGSPRGARNFRRRGPGGDGYFGWPAAARARTGRAALALRGKLIAAELVQALENRARS